MHIYLCETVSVCKGLSTDAFVWVCASVCVATVWRSFFVCDRLYEVVFVCDYLHLSACMWLRVWEGSSVWGPVHEGANLHVYVKVTSTCDHLGVSFSAWLSVESRTFVWVTVWAPVCECLVWGSVWSSTSLGWPVWGTVCSRDKTCVSMCFLHMESSIRLVFTF